MQQIVSPAAELLPVFPNDGQEFIVLRRLKLVEMFIKPTLVLYIFNTEYSNAGRCILHESAGNLTNHKSLEQLAQAPVPTE